MITVSSGHSASYLTDQVAVGRENYYTGAVAAGEPPGRWYGKGAEALGLVGLVDNRDMTALYEHYVDPRDERFRNPSQWQDADKLGHVGRKYISEAELYKAALDAQPHATAERRAELKVDAGRRARRNVAFFDATFSVQKSITVLHAAFEAQQVAAERAGDELTAKAWGEHREAVEDAIWAGNQAGLDYLEQHAGYSRVGHHGGAAGRWVDAHEFVIASFFQHDSRDHDPQLHIHNAILNRIQGPDGQWRTVDGRGIYAHRGAAAAVAERTMEEHLTRSLGVRFAARPDGKAREILGVPQPVMDLFSSRRRAITGKTFELVAAFEARFERAPNALELDRLQRQATFATRRAKTHDSETVEERLDRWDRELRAEVAGGLEKVARDVLHLAGAQPTPGTFTREAVLEAALADVQSRKSAWARADLVRAISDNLPDHLGPLDGADVSALLDGLAEEALPVAIPIDAARPGAEVLPEELRLADGTSAYEAPGRRRYATPEHVHTERLLAAATTDRTAARVDAAAVTAHLEGLSATGIHLGADQAAAVRGVLTSGASVETLVGPAGTGKSFVVGVLAKAWQKREPDGAERAPHVVGLASSQIATEVLAGEGLHASNITRWLNAQRRLDDPAASGVLRAEDEQWRLQAGDLVVVDESAMTSTADLAAVHTYARAAGAKLLLTGDHRQLAAVGAGGGMDLLADVGLRYELAEARRFTNPWEATASLGLREGDPSALREYYKHGRLIDCGSAADAETSAAGAWLADTLAGKQSVLIVDTNDTAARVSAALRADLVRLRRVTEHGVPLDRQGTFAGVGDLVQARANAWDLAGHEGNRRGPINRERYRVLETRSDGSLIVTTDLEQPAISADNADIAETPTGFRTAGERLVLPAAYVTQHVTLGYAITAHAAQGITVDTSHLLAAPGTGAAAVYVGLSRGRERNTAYVVTCGVDEDAPPGMKIEPVYRNPIATLTRAFEATDPERSAIAAAADSIEDNASVRTAAELFSDGVELATAGRTARWLDELVYDGHLNDTERAAFAAEDGAATLQRLLRRVELAGHDPRGVLRGAVVDRSLHDARQVTNVVHHRITETIDLQPVGDRYSDWLPRVEDQRWTTYLHHLAETADTRMAFLGEQLAKEPPPWAIGSLGPVPTDAEERADWIHRAATVAAYRDVAGIEDATVALRRAAAQGRPEAAASWRAAWTALGRPEADREEAELSDGQLRLRIRAWEREQNWAPDFVADRLAATHQAIDEHRARAITSRTAADAATNDAERDRLLAAAAATEQRALELEPRARDLTAADEVRALWYLHTAATRAAAEAADHELQQRGLDRAEPDPEITAEQWLAEQRGAEREEDPHRVVRDEAELHDTAAERTADLNALDRQRPGSEQVEAHEPDLRAVSVKPPTETTFRVPTADETAASIARAQRAIHELSRRRQAEEQARAAYERSREDAPARDNAQDRAPSIGW